MTRTDILRMQRAMLTVPGVTMPRFGADGALGSEFWAAFALTIQKAGGRTVEQRYEVTERVALEILHHEAIVREAYKDSVDVWTWGVGQTAASGIKPLDYKDKPAEVAEVIASFVQSLRVKYGPEVAKAFNGAPLTEAQFAAALSFHYNTGSIGRASWVRHFLDGLSAGVQRDAFLEWRFPASIKPRRLAEAALFFDGVWSHDGFTTEWPVRKPSYAPDWGKGKRIDARPAVRAALAA